jgi:hypothetical protein
MEAAGWRVKYDGICSRCGTPLRAGEVAVYERSTKTMHCVVCPTPGAVDPEPVIDSGTAGASARREYERRKAGREARIKGKVGDRLGGAIIALTNDPQSTRAWATGAQGEEKLAKALEGIDGLRLLHDRRVPGTRGNIDHIVIAPAGIFVVDAKHYEGRIEIRNRGNIFRPDRRLYVGRRDCSSLATGLAWQVDAVANALRDAGVEPPPPITPVLCFIDGDWPLFGAPDEFAGVRLEGPKSLRRVATATSVLGASEIERLAHIIGSVLPAK